MLSVLADHAPAIDVVKFKVGACMDLGYPVDPWLAPWKKRGTVTVLPDRI
jgi:hypothetical protein